MSKTWGEIREEALRRCEQLPPKTNADRIRAMTDEELARFRAYGCCPENRYMNDYECDYFHGDCEKCWLDWLKQEVTDD